MARAVSRDIPAEGIGRLDQILATRDATLAAMATAGIADADDVAYVMVKTAVVTPEALADASARGASPRTADLHASKTYARAASALGVAVALGEVPEAALTDTVVAMDRSLFCTRACSTAGIDRPRNEVVVFGMAQGWSADFVVGHGVMADMIDSGAVAHALADAGLSGLPQLDAAARARLAYVIVKGEPPRDGAIRGRRHVMWRDSDVHALRHYRAALGGMLAGMTGDTRFYLSAGAEHQGPPGGGTIAVFARTGQAMLDDEQTETPR
jgi:cyanuric acid amidohydrolase